MEFSATPIQTVSAARAYGRGQDGSGREEEVQRRKGSGTERAAGTVQDILELSQEARRELEKLKARDREVRAHEAAHLAAGSGVVRGGASYTYQRGPDGQAYAVGGEVSIDTSPVPGDPRATLAKAQQIRSAALAPADPSPQDLKVAAAASQMAAQASRELAMSSPTGAKGNALDLMA